MPKNSANEFKHQFLETLHILPYSEGENNNIYLFGLVEKTPPNRPDDTEKLWHFVKILVAKSSNELTESNFEVNEDLRKRGKKFICDRLQLLLASGYANLSTHPTNYEGDKEIIDTSIWRLKFGEKLILESCLNYFSLNY